jgi:hypothetical protein
MKICGIHFASLFQVALFHAALTGVCLQAPAMAFGERIFPELSPARQAAQYPKQGLDLEWRNSLLVKLNSSDLPKYERRTPAVIGGVRGFGTVDLTSRLHAFSDLYVAGVFEQESETTDGPATSADSRFFAYGGRSGFGMRTDGDLEFDATAEVRALGERSSDRENAGLKSKTSTSSYVLWRPGFVLKKISQQWVAAAFYELGDSEKISVKTSVAGDTRTEETYATLAPRFGGFFNTEIGGNLGLGCELSFIRGSASPVTAGSQKVFDNSYRVAFHLLFERGAGSSLWLSISHDTASYAKQDFMAFENIPVTEFETTYSFHGGFYAGAITSFSEDKQSTEEINRNFMLYGVGLRTGIKLPNL